MQAIDLRDALKNYTEGWIAVDKKTNTVVAHEKTFESISRRVKRIKDILLIPASKNYFGFVTSLHA